MSETPPADTPPTDQPQQTDAPPDQPQQPTQQDVSAEPEYSALDLAEQWQALGCQPWDVAGIFTAKNATTMTIPDFEAALLEWRTPVQTQQAQQQGSN